MTQRVRGFDIARALAIFGMVIVNFRIAMEANQGNEILLWFVSLFEGRASALFVIVAGVSITFLTKKQRCSTNDYSALQIRLDLCKRGALLIVVGLAYTLVWEADILHFYGAYFFIAAVIFTTTNRKLILISSAIVFVFPMLLVFFDYEQGWDWSTYSYKDFWSFHAMFRRVFFNGFHPVFPWSAFLIFGMWLGRQDLSSNRVKRKLMFYSVVTWFLTELIFGFLVEALKNEVSVGLSHEDIESIFGTTMMLPMPQYVLAAGSCAVFVIVNCLYLAEKFCQSKLLLYLYQTGKLSLTLYVAHIVFGLGILDLFGYLGDQPIHFSFFSAIFFCIVAIVFSVVWLKYFELGPLEWVYKRLLFSKIFN